MGQATGGPGWDDFSSHSQRLKWHPTQTFHAKRISAALVGAGVSREMLCLGQGRLPPGHLAEVDKIFVDHRITGIPENL